MRDFDVELLPELVVRALAVFEQRYLDWARGFGAEQLARELELWGEEVAADGREQRVRLGDWEQGWSLAAHMVDLGLLERRTCRAIEWELVPEIRRDLIAKHNLVERYWTDRWHYEIDYVTDLTRPLEDWEFPDLLPAPEVKAECGCVVRRLRNGWSVRRCCGAHEWRGAFLALDEDGDRLAWGATWRRAIKEAALAAERPRRPPEALKPAARYDAFGRQWLACGWWVEKTHYGRGWEVYEPGGDPSGGASCVGWGVTRKEALGRAGELLTQRADAKDAKHPPEGQMELPAR